MLSGYSIPMSFIIGWVLGLGSMVALIAVVYALSTVQKTRASSQQSERAYVAVF
jgi:hypothetical protein